MPDTAINRVSENLEKIQAFIDILDESEKQNCRLIDLVKELDDEQQDLLHEFELDKFYRTEGHRKARRLKKVRQLRRVAKDTIELWRPIKEFAKQHKKLKLELQSMINEVKHGIYDQNSRVYIPRVEKESCIAGKHFPSKAIDLTDKVIEMEEEKKKRRA